MKSFFAKNKSPNEKAFDRLLAITDQNLIHDAVVGYCKIFSLLEPKNYDLIGKALKEKKPNYPVLRALNNELDRLVSEVVRSQVLEMRNNLDKDQDNDDISKALEVMEEEYFLLKKSLVDHNQALAILASKAPTSSPQLFSGEEFKKSIRDAEQRLAEEHSKRKTQIISGLINFDPLSSEKCKELKRTLKSINLVEDKFLQQQKSANLISNDSELEDLLSVALLSGADKSAIKFLLRNKEGIAVEAKHLELVDNSNNEGVNQKSRELVNIIANTNYTKLTDQLQQELIKGSAADVDKIDDLFCNQGLVKELQRNSNFAEWMFAEKCHPDLIRLVFKKGIGPKAKDVQVIYQQHNQDYKNQYPSEKSALMEDLLLVYFSDFYKESKGLPRGFLDSLKTATLLGKDIDQTNKDAFDKLQKFISNWGGQDYDQEPDQKKADDLKEILDLQYKDKNIIQPSDIGLLSFVVSIIDKGSDTDIRTLRRSGYFELLDQNQDAHNARLMEIIGSKLEEMVGQPGEWNQNTKNKAAQLIAIYQNLAGKISAKDEALFQSAREVFSIYTIKSDSQIEKQIELQNKKLEDFAMKDRSVDDLKAILESNFCLGDSMEYCVRRDNPKIAEMLKEAIKKSDVNFATALIDLGCVDDKALVAKRSFAYNTNIMVKIAFNIAVDELVTKKITNGNACKILDKLTKKLEMVCGDKEEGSYLQLKSTLEANSNFLANYSRVTGGVPKELPSVFGKSTGAVL